MNNFNQNNGENSQNQTNHQPVQQPPYNEEQHIGSVSSDYNPYRDDLSVFNEIKSENPIYIYGPEQLPNEADQTYAIRKCSEWIYVNAESKKKLKKSSTYMGAFVLLYIALSFAISFALQFCLALLGNSAFAESLIDNFSMVSQYIIIFPIIFILANIRKKHKVKTFFKKPKMSGLSIFKWSVIALGLTYAVALIFDAIFSILSQFGLNVNDLSLPVPTSPLDLFVYAIVVAVCAPIFEEILFRGIFLTNHMKFGCWHAAIVTGVLFGLIHMNHQQMFFATALGILFAYIDIKAGSIIPSIIAHVAVNLYSVINTVLLSFTNYNELLESGSLDAMLDAPMIVLALIGIFNILVFIFIAVAAILLIVEIVSSPKSFKLPKGSSGLSGIEKTKAFISSPVMILTLVVMGFLIFLNSFMPLA